MHGERERERESERESERGKSLRVREGSSELCGERDLRSRIVALRSTSIIEGKVEVVQV